MQTDISYYDVEYADSRCYTKFDWLGKKCRANQISRERSLRESSKHLFFFCFYIVENKMVEKDTFPSRIDRILVSTELWLLK